MNSQSDNPTPTEIIRKRMEYRREPAKAEMDHFRKTLDKDPVMAMQTADGAFMATARIREYAYLEKALEAVDQGTLEISKLYNAVQKPLETSQPRQFSYSSSPSSNLMERAKSIVSVEWATHPTGAWPKRYSQS